ncbi:hypothetical protein GALMADRAFT_60000 [Galerina marginata CBS 339.88]|uniref:Uncharacterized protein n=1 Tax=Galerina marginata (strain CBS 339.88) TaxID=685588 RepID=A0A067TNA2_GALM3|nr:hypothetical protein GALMADRAFT_60000 [Galerina marginata CBS 339.88]
MPRRSPPSSLRLTQGPMPPRSAPKHTLPSLPRPAFRRPSEGELLQAQMRARERHDGIVTVAREEKEKRIRGPWDHSGSISVAVDVDRLLQTPARALVVG